MMFIFIWLYISEQRKAEAAKIRTKYPDRIPVSRPCTVNLLQNQIW